MDAQSIQSQVQYVIPLGVVVVIAVASLIIGFLLNAITFWNLFTTRTACIACKDSSDKISKVQGDSIKEKLDRAIEHLEGLDGRLRRMEAKR